MNFCSQCAHPVTLRCLEGDTRQRFVCDGCRAVHYSNPKVLVACVAYFGDRLLMCRRAQEPGYGLWEVPAGFVEEGESLEDATVREVAEETGVRIRPEQLQLYSLLSLPALSQVYVVFRSELVTTPAVCRGSECLDVALMAERELSPDQWAFGGRICGSPEVLFREIRTRRFSVHKQCLTDLAFDRVAARVGCRADVAGSPDAEHRHGRSVEWVPTKARSTG